MENNYPEEELQNTIRSCIRNFITRNGITRKELADKMGIVEGVVRNYLSTKPISHKTITNFAKALDYPEEFLRKGIPYYKPSDYEVLEKRIDGLWNRNQDLEKRVKTLEDKMRNY